MNKWMNEPPSLCIPVCLLRAPGPAWKNTWWGSSCSGFQAPLGQGRACRAWAGWTKAGIVRPGHGGVGAWRLTDTQAA